MHIYLVWEVLRERARLLAVMKALGLPATRWMKWLAVSDFALF